MPDIGAEEEVAKVLIVDYNGTELSLKLEQAKGSAQKNGAPCRHLKSI